MSKQKKILLILALVIVVIAAIILVLNPFGNKETVTVTVTEGPVIEEKNIEESVELSDYPEDLIDAASAWAQNTKGNPNVDNSVIDEFMETADYIDYLVNQNGDVEVNILAEEDTTSNTDTTEKPDITPVLQKTVNDGVSMIVGGYDLSHAYNGDGTFDPNKMTEEEIKAASEAFFGEGTYRGTGESGHWELPANVHAE